MAAGAEVVIKGIEDVGKLFKQGREYCSATLERAGMHFIGDVKEEAPKDTGQMAGSWFLHKISDFEYVARPNSKYAIYVQEGRAPGSAPPFAPIERWAARHNLPAYPVWRKIWKKGIAPNRFVDRALERTMKDFENLAAEARVKMEAS